MANRPPLTTRDTSLNLAYLGAGLLAIVTLMASWITDMWIFQGLPAEAHPVWATWQNLEFYVGQLLATSLDVIAVMCLAAAVTLFSQWRARGLSPVHHNTVSDSVVSSLRPLLWAMWAITLVAVIWGGAKMLVISMSAQALLLSAGALSKVEPTYRKRAITTWLLALFASSWLILSWTASSTADTASQEDPGNFNGGLLFGFHEDAIILAVSAPAVNLIAAVFFGPLFVALCAAALVRDPKQLKRWHLYICGAASLIWTIAILLALAAGWSLHSMATSPQFGPQWWMLRLLYGGSVISPFFGGMLFLRWILRGGQCWHRRPIQVIQACGRSVLTLLVLATFVPPALALACRLAGYPTVDYRFSPLLLIVFTIPAIAWADWIHRTNRVAWCERGLAIVLNINDLRVPTTWVETGRITLRCGDTNGEPTTKH